MEDQRACETIKREGGQRLIHCHRTEAPAASADGCVPTHLQICFKQTVQHAQRSRNDRTNHGWTIQVWARELKNTCGRKGDNVRGVRVREGKSTAKDETKAADFKVPHGTRFHILLSSGISANQADRVCYQNVTKHFQKVSYLS